MKVFRCQFSVLSVYKSIFLLCFVTSAFAQQPATRRIEVNRSDFIELNSRVAPGAQRVIGDVEFEHEGMTMTCDSAYLYNQTNTLDAFSRVHITNADTTVTIDGDFAKYHGNIRFAEVWGNVVLVDSNAILKTEHLYYDMNTEIAYYLTGGEIFDRTNNMVSIMGHYHRNVDMFYFKTDVVLNTPDYVITTDTLDYNVNTEVAYFVGPTFIVNVDNDTIYCERGWYDTNDTIAFFRQNAWLKSGSSTINADTLFYENHSGNGLGFGNIVVVDTANNVIVKGQQGKFHRPTELSWMTGRALLILPGEQDTLFLHADTLRMDVDTAGYRILRAYDRVRFFSLDLQGKCDSLIVSLQDTIIHMYRNPILWAQDNQMTAEYIVIETENQKPKRLFLNTRGFIVQEDPEGFNQIRARRIVGLFHDGELYRVNGFNDSETIYFLYDGPLISAANKARSTDVVILIEERQAQQVSHIDNAEGAMIPFHEFDPMELTLNGFRWLIDLKPVDRDDIFEWKTE